MDEEEFEINFNDNKCFQASFEDTQEDEDDFFDEEDDFIDIW